ncbi:MAG: excinuclease ABC subunit C [Azospirillum brasilense]|nr:MAG: excinuclease ABC subunit C [Azospirillum brasilense]
MHAYHVYIMATGRNGTFYVGMTSDLARRIYEHRERLVPGFTKRYAVKRLVYYETHSDVHEAIRREKALKRWTRQKKMHAIEENNPDWEDLFHDLNQ